MSRSMNIVHVLVVGVMALSLSACNKSKKSKSSPAPSAPQTQSQSPSSDDHGQQSRGSSRSESVEQENSEEKKQSEIQPQLEKPLYQKVADLEKELKKYGVHFITKEENKIRYSGTTRYNDKYISVEIRQQSSDDDLKTLGLDPGQRDELIEKMVALSDEIEKEKYISSYDTYKKMAALKVKVVRNQVMLPRFMNVYAEAMLTKSLLVPFTEKSRALRGLYLWNVDGFQGTNVTNDEVLQDLNATLKIHEEYERLKKDVLSLLIRDIEETQDVKRQMNQGSYRRRYLHQRGPEDNPDEKIDEFLRQLRKAEKETVLNAQQKDLFERLVDIFSKIDHEGTDEFAPVFALHVNDELLNDKRFKVLEKLSSLIDEAKRKLNIEFNYVSGEILIDEISISRAKVNDSRYIGKSTVIVVEANEAMARYRDYLQFTDNVTQYEDQEKILKKAQLLIDNL